MWIKYQHGFASHKGNMEWRELSEMSESDDIEYIVEEIEAEHSWSDKYRGCTYEVVDSAPGWIIKQKLDSAENDRHEAVMTIKRLTQMLDSAKPCPQCNGAEAWRNVIATINVLKNESY